MEYDEMLVKHVGGMGKFQKIYIFSFFFFALPFFSSMVELVFHGLTASHICSTPELDQFATKYQLSFDQILKISAPQEEAKKHQQCHVIQRDYANFTQEDVNTLLEGNFSEGDQTLQSCSNWKYDRSAHGLLLAEQFNLVCDQEWLLTQTQTYNMAGMLVGIFVFGWVGDRFGRKPAMLSSLVLVILSRVGSIVSPFFSLFIAFRVVCLGTSMGFYTQGYLMGLEMVSPKWRSTTGLLSMLGFSLVDVTTAGFAYFLQDYRWVMVADSLFLIPYLSYFWLLPESARWLFATGNLKQGKAVLSRMARINGVTLPDDYDIRHEEEKEKPSPVTLFKSPEMRKRTIANCALWFTVSLVSYGLVFNAVNLSGSVYINVLIMGATVVGAWLHSHFALQVKFLGRRRNIFGVMVLSGLCLLCILPVPKDVYWVSISLYMVGKTAVSSSFNMIYVHTPETMPTEIRSTGVSFASTSARVGGILAPYLALIGRGNKTLPSIIMGVLTILTAFVVFFLPETFGQVLPDTISQVETSAKKQKIRVKDEPQVSMNMLEKASPSDC